MTKLTDAANTEMQLHVVNSLEARLPLLWVLTAASHGTFLPPVWLAGWGWLNGWADQPAVRQPNQ